MDIETAEKIVTECQEMKSKIESAREATEANGRRAEERLNELKDSLPNLLASKVLGEVTGGEVAEAKAEVATLESSISDMGLTLQGLQARQEQANDELAKASKVLTRYKAAQRYDSIKSQLTTRYSKDADGYLRQAAKEIGVDKCRECEAFLRDVKQAWENTSLQQRAL